MPRSSDLILGYPGQVETERTLQPPLGSRNDELLGQCRRRNAVRLAQARAAPRHEVRHTPPCQARGHRLNGVAQQPEAAFDGELHEPNVIRATLTRWSTENSGSGPNHEPNSLGGPMEGPG